MVGMKAPVSAETQVSRQEGRRGKLRAIPSLKTLKGQLREGRSPMLEAMEDTKDPCVLEKHYPGEWTSMAQRIN